METEKELNSKILEITMNIQREYPELTKYLSEMPETIPDEKDHDITIKSLKTYYDSLSVLVNDYKQTHTSAKK